MPLQLEQESRVFVSQLFLLQDQHDTNSNCRKSW